MHSIFLTQVYAFGYSKVTADAKVKFIKPSEIMVVDHLDFGVIKTMFGRSNTHWVKIDTEGVRASSSASLLVPSVTTAGYVMTYISEGAQLNVQVNYVSDNKGYYTLKDFVCRYNATQARCDETPMLIVGEVSPNNQADIKIGATAYSNGVGAEIGSDDSYFNVTFSYL